MLGDADGELQANAFIARQQRQEAVRRGGRDQFDASAILEAAQRADEIAVQRAEQLQQAGQPFVPIFRHRDEL